MHRGTWCPLLCLTTGSRPCGRAQAPCPNSSVGTWKKGVFTLVPSEYRTRAPCPGIKYKRCLILLACPWSVQIHYWGRRNEKCAEKSQWRIFQNFFLRSGTKQTVLTVPSLFFLFRRALSSCCLQQTCPCKHPVSMFISVCNISFWLQLFKGWIALSNNLYPLDNAIIVSCHNTYPLDSDLSIG